MPVPVPPVIRPLTALAALTLTLSLTLSCPLSAPARADSTLATSGPYTLTQSLVDADVAYWGWAAGRALAPAEQRRLAAIDVARFRRDPAWSVKALGAEQKSLAYYRTREAAFQSTLRRIVLADIPHLQDDRLTPDEARQMQQIAAGVPASVAPTSAPRMAARPDAPVDTRLPAHGGPYTMTQGMVDTDMAVAQWAAARPLTAAERRQVTAIDVAQFRRDPAWTVKALRREVADLKALARMDAVRLADWRKANIVSDTFHTADHLTPAEDATMLGIYTRANPVLGADAATRTVVTRRDVDAWVAATRLIARKAGIPGPDARFRADLCAEAGEKSSPQVRGVMGNMERDWAAFQLTWPRLSAAAQAAHMGAAVRLARQQGIAGARGAALGLCLGQYGLYASAGPAGAAGLQTGRAGLLAAHMKGLLDRKELDMLHDAFHDPNSPFDDR